ncbi:MAG TPA: hypothetical protein VJH92_04170 [Candidatus Nanoarchaeia archaeon]|nr:hypothetical protein [Candidatus Nanoarchaeia archaeon]
MEKIEKEESKKLNGMFFLELTFFLLIFFLISIYYSKDVFAGVGGNVTQISQLTIGSSAPNIININAEGSITLLPNSTKQINCSVIIEDYDDETDLANVTAVFFHNSSSYGAADDNNSHYTNNNCSLNLSYGDTSQVLASCLFNLTYFANAGTWNCSVNATDFSIQIDQDSNSTQIQQLLAVGLPDSIDYGVINSTFVSPEQNLNVTNFGNMQLNLSLHSYGYVNGDNNSMNCTLGASKNISAYYEKYNLTNSTSGPLTLGQFESNYSNLTGSPSTKTFQLNYRQNDSVQGVDDANSTYWRIYVPTGVAGSCSGNIVFGATTANGV